ncbi:hypothetical protein [Microtetraspora malaysiensis]|uniref:Uncharacterized protein n=1 Tax=Microtetraspora malaysiensis TaxID=161358 RepID=A0ABW6SKA8_9ACTN
MKTLRRLLGLYKGRHARPAEPARASRTAAPPPAIDAGHTRPAITREIRRASYPWNTEGQPR